MRWSVSAAMHFALKNYHTFIEVNEESIILKMDNSSMHQYETVCT
ncbi:MAG: hypothetical protein SH856_00355 [Flavobacteriales bacterium]|nr:hypothetical protein [Flavobacteriales bacterium]